MDTANLTHDRGEGEDNINIIPTNSDTFLMDNTTIRFSSASWYKAIREKEILLVGIGGIGSFVGFLLSRVKPKRIHIFDDDIVDSSNMSGQLYSLEDIDKTKVSALSDMMLNYSDYYTVDCHHKKYASCSGASDIMICGLDSMEARQIFFHNWKNHVMNTSADKRSNCLYIDGRLSAEEFQVFCIRGDDEYNMNRYSTEYLFNDSEAESTVCSYKQTTFMSNMIASVMVNLFVNFVANQCNPIIDRALPFYTGYTGELMYLKTEL